MEDKNCEPGQCGAKNQTSLRAINFLKGNADKGFVVFVVKDESVESGFRKDIALDLSYAGLLEKENPLVESCVSFRFVPYGLDSQLDSDVLKMKNGPVEPQLKK